MVICSLILRHQSGHSPLRLRLFVPPPSFSTFNFELSTSSSPTFQCAARLPRPGLGAGACPELLGALDFSSLGLTFNFQPSTFNCVFFPSPHLCALCVLCGKNSLSFRSSLIPRHSSLATNSFTIRTSETPLPQLLYNPHLQAPLGSAGNRGLITPLESALTRNSPATPLESPLTKTGGGVLPGVHSRSSLLSFAGDSTWPMQRLSLRGLGGSSELRRLWDAGASDHLCEFARRGRPARASRTARCRVRA